MRICLFAHADNHHVLRWTRYLSGKGHEIRIFCDDPGPAGFRERPPCEVIHPKPSLVEAAICFKIWRHRYGWNFFRARAYREAAREFRPDVVHAMEALAYGYAVSRCAEFPRVLTPWGVDIFHDPFQSRVARWLVTHALNHVEAVTTNMPNLAEYLVPEFGVDPERVRPFSWGVELDIFHTGYESEVAALRKRLDIPDDALVICSPRSCRPYWGAEHIVDAIPRVLAEVPRAWFVLLRGYGETGPQMEYKRRLEAAGCAGRVRWIDETLPPREMAVVLNLSDAFISVPSTDLLSISVLEGMACGSIPIAADRMAYRSRLQDRHNALLVPTPVNGERLAEAMIAFAAHPEWKPVFRERNLALIREKDDWAKNAGLMEEVYQWAIDHPLGGRKRS